MSVSVSEMGWLPAVRAGDRDWLVQAACRGRDVEVFFHPERERGLDRDRRVQRAKAICDPCPVIIECQRWALAVGEPYGVWGGLTPEERRHYNDRRLVRHESSQACLS